ncbi:hypothetical protein [Thalassotalea litorea]|uniref:hypothetical protein n=1 Tax=Thalassotalea litorea TaxID=2020715 RepID=UPI003735E1E3
MKILASLTCLVVLFISTFHANAIQINGFVDYYEGDNWEVDAYIDEHLDTYEGHIGLSYIPTVEISSERMGLEGGHSIVGSLVGAGDSFIIVEIAIPASGTITFDWSYYVGGWDLEFRLEPFGYLLNGTFYHLAADPDIGYDSEQYFDLLEEQQGSASISVQAGDEFGFTLFSEDNFLSYPIVSIFNFSAPAPESVPESNTLILALVSALLLLTRKSGLSKYMKV